MVVVAWCVLALVFLDEVLALVALGWWGWHQDPAWLWVWLLPLVAAQAWFWFASPKARFGHWLGRPVVKVLVFGSASAALWDGGRPGLAGGFLVFSAAINALALLPAVSRVLDEPAAEQAAGADR
ncbi:YrdB family protein [Nocardioides sp.]|uniref:YrdB family protein n=1 Tax=Nocardioides sp. TaxID=35761 RepID=UPI0037840854